MRVCVFGLGHVGAVSTACLAALGHHVTGVDVDSATAERISRGETSIIEPGLLDLMRSGVEAKLISATTDAAEGLRNADVALVTVGTPATATGSTDLGFVRRVMVQVAQMCSTTRRLPVIVLRSTVPPGTLEQCVALVRDSSQGKDFHMAFNPEFLREGSAVSDFMEPAYTIIGTQDPAAEQAVRDLYKGIDAPVFVTASRVAEMLKYVANSWHAAKIAFSNEVGRLSQGLGIDGREVMRLIVEDHKLNVSSAYMNPGFAYGGSCLPKDLDSILHLAQAMHVPVPLLSGIRETNRLHIDLVADQMLRLGPRRVGVLGLAFKPRTDDLRESPAVVLCERLLNEGCELRIFDRAVSAAHLMGTNHTYIRQKLPHLEPLLVTSPEEAVREADTVAITYASPEFAEALAAAPAEAEIFDLAGLLTAVPSNERYHGIAW